MRSTGPSISLNARQWARAAYWTWEEFEYVAVGIDPQKVRNVDPSIPLDLRDKDRQTVRAALEFHFRSGSFPAKFSPEEGIAIAKRADLSLPVELVREISEYGGSANANSKPELSGSSLNSYNTLLQGFLGMAVRRYGYDPNLERQNAVAEIVKDLEDVGLRLDAKTVRSKLKAATDNLTAEQEIGLDQFIEGIKGNF